MPTTGTASVVNGSISNWPLGVSGNLDLEGHPVASIRHVRFRDNGVAIDAVQADVTVKQVAIIGSNDGVVAFSGANVTITDAVFRDNDRAAVAGTSQLLSLNRSTLVNNRVGVDCSESTCRVRGSRITGSDTAVASFFGQVVLKGNRIVDNTTGYAPGFSTDDTVQGNRFARNDVAVSVAGFAGAQIRDNTFTANRVGYTTVDDQVEGYSVTLIGNRFFRNVDGVFVTAAGTSLGHNIARHNQGWGIFAPGATDLGGNISDHNGNQPQCVGVAC